MRIEIHRIKGKYNFTIMTTDKTLEKLLWNEFVSLSPLPQTEKLYISQINRSQFSIILDAIMKATKQALLPGRNGLHHPITTKNRVNAEQLSATTESTEIDQICTDIHRLD